MYPSKSSRQADYFHGNFGIDRRRVQLEKDLWRRIKIEDFPRSKNKNSHTVLPVGGGFPSLIDLVLEHFLVTIDHFGNGKLGHPLPI